MIVVADTSVLIILSQMGRFDLLHSLFGTVVIPPEVEVEYDLHPDQDGFMDFRELTWLFVQSATNGQRWSELDDGESAAINLALELKPDFLLMDERKGRRVAKQLNLKMTGTIGILERAARKGLIELAIAFEELKRTDFYVSEKLLAQRLALFESRNQDWDHHDGS